MRTTKIKEALASLRASIFEEITNVLSATEEHRVELEVEFPGSIDDDRYSTETVTALYLDEDGYIKVESHDDYYDENEEGDIDTYSVDQLLKIVEAL